MPNASRWNDEWWTTQQVLGFLKLKRKALWELREKPKRGFPAHARFGGKFNLYPAADIRLWAESQMRGTRSRPAPPQKSPQSLPVASPSASAPAASAAAGSIALCAASPQPEIGSAPAKAFSGAARRKKRTPDINQLDLFG